MTIAVNNVKTGTAQFSTFGGAGSISSSQVGTIDSSGANQLIVAAFISGRSQATDVHNAIRVSAVNASGLTFTRKATYQWYYNNSALGNPSFPWGEFSIDIFTAPAASQQTAKSWTTTNTGDGIINNQQAWVFAVSGLADITNCDAIAAMFQAENLIAGTGSPTAPRIPNVTVASPESLVFETFFTRQTGYTYTGFTSGYTSAGQNSPGGDSTSGFKGVTIYGAESAPIVNKTIGDESGGTTDHWVGVLWALGTPTVLPQIERSFPVIIL
jgi:hypothetical protein